LSRWILHRQDPSLSKKAEDYFYRLAQVFENHMEGSRRNYSLPPGDPNWFLNTAFRKQIKDRILKIFQTTKIS